MLQLDVQFLALVASIIIPALVGAVAKWNAKTWFKALCNAILSIAAAAASIAIAADGTVEIGDWIFQAILTYGTSELAYQRIYKPTGTAEFIKEMVPGGIGPEKEPAELPPAPTSTTQVHEVTFPPVVPEPVAPVVPDPEPAAPITMPGTGPDPAAAEEITLPPPRPVRKAAPRKAAAPRSKRPSED
jgi:hypothetical protein